jgi:hypothetical protein
MAGCIQRLAGTEQLAAESRIQHAGAGAGGAVQHQHGGVLGIAQGDVMLLQFGQPLAGVKAEVMDEEVTLMTRGAVCAGCGQRGREQSG